MELYSGGSNLILWGDLIAAFQHLKGAYRKDGENLFSKACCDRKGVMTLN